MSNYLLIETQDPLEFKDTENFISLAKDLKTQGNSIVYYLVENGVFPARRCSFSSTLESLLKMGVTIYADKFSLKERGISKNVMLSGLKIVDTDEIIDLIADGHKTLWH